MVSGTRKKRTQQPLARYGLITSWRVDLHIHSQRHRAALVVRESGLYIELEGELTEPVAGVGHFSILIFQEKEASPTNPEVAAIGSFIKTKPTLQAAIRLLPFEFQSLLQLVTANRLRSCHMAFHAPFRNRSLITSLSFSSALPDQESL